MAPPTRSTPTKSTPTKSNGSHDHAAHAAPSGAREAANAAHAAPSGAREAATAARAATASKSPDARCGPEEHAKRLRKQTINDEQLERAAAIFRAAGDVSRLKLLHRLCDGEWCVTELAEAANVGLSTVSQQLRLLRAERIVARRRAGKHIFYSLADTHVSDLIQSGIEHASEPHAHHHDAHDHDHEGETP